MEGATRDELLEGRDLVGLLELGSDEEGRDADQLQLTGSYCFISEVLVDEGDDREEGFGEHLEFLVQFREPVDQLASIILTD